MTDSKRRRSILSQTGGLIGIWSVAGLIAAVGSFLLFTYLRPQPSYKDSVAFVRSVQEFVESHERRGSPLPASVSLHDLVNEGYITPNMARLFKGAEVTFPHRSSASVPLKQAPEEVLIKLRQRDGRETVMTADGSVHPLSKTRRSTRR